MKSNILLALLLTTTLGTAAFASEVYIDQAGSSTTIDITQTGTANRVGTAANQSVVDGNNIDIDLVQTGSNNEADLQLTLASTSTVIDYDTTGDTNILDVAIGGGTGNSLTSLITGDDNRITMCATNDLAGFSTATDTPYCATSMTVNDTTNIANINGSRNQINLELDSANATNTINVGPNLISNDNVINLTQTGADVHTVTLNVDGDTNVINILQQDAIAPQL